MFTIEKRVSSFGEEMDRKDLRKKISVVHLLSATLTLSALSSRAKPELARAKRFDPSSVG